jgi:hypothetical protein
MKTDYNFLEFKDAIKDLQEKITHLEDNEFYACGVKDLDKMETRLSSIEEKQDEILTMLDELKTNK